MCYDVVAHTKKKLDYAIKRGWDEDSIKKLHKALEGLDGDLLPFYKSSGFEHPKLLCFCNDNPSEPEALEWGLIPSWTTDAEQAQTLQNKTLNARIETLHEKASYAEAYQNRRCIIMLDGFYEHFHKGSKKYPHLIRHQDEKPMVMAGLWDVWLDDAGVEQKTITMVTCKANSFMSAIHNNPKLKEPRMPLILEDELVNQWLGDMNEDELKAFQQSAEAKTKNLKLKSHTVKPLKGKQALGNTESVLKEVQYAELQPGLFD